MSARKPRELNEYRLLCHEGGDQLFRMTWPPNREGFIDSFIKPYEGSAFDAYCFDTNIAGTMMFYDSNVGEMFGRHITTFLSGSALRQYEIIKQLCAEGNDPPKLAVDGARAAGMDCFLRLRMNDLHDRLGFGKVDKPSIRPKIGTIEPGYYPSRFKRQHPELLLGNPAASFPENSYEAWEAFAYNYALKEVRDLYYNLAEEIVTRYEPDGLQLDFLRFPFFFSRPQAYDHRHLLTALVRRIRKCVDDVSKQCGRSIYLIVDVPETIESALRAGIDTANWLKEGLLDIVTISRGYYPFSSPWNEVVALAKKAGVPAFACFNYGKSSGWKDADADSGYLLGQQTLRAAAYRALYAGAQGCFLFNFFFQSPSYNRQRKQTIGFGFTHDLVDIQKLANSTLTYELDRTFEAKSALAAAAHQHTAWQGQVPLTIGVGEVHQAVFDLAKPSRPVEARLELQLIDPHFDDKIEFFWNDEAIHAEPSEWSGLSVNDEFVYTFILKPQQLKSGENRLGIHLKERDQRLEPFVTLDAALLTLVGE